MKIGIRLFLSNMLMVRNRDDFFFVFFGLEVREWEFCNRPELPLLSILSFN
jgi:hypothetical protein